jgi:hypothetical protein
MVSSCIPAMYPAANSIHVSTPITDQDQQIHVTSYEE